MTRRAIIAVALAAPAPATAHDAFGDLGPFYASFLHPLADPMQAALIVGTAAFLAGRPLPTARVALPVFVMAAVLAQVFAGAQTGIAPGPLLVASALVVIGVSAFLPGRWTPLWLAAVLVFATGALAGLAPGPLPGQGALQPLAGGTLGIAVMAVLSWAALDALSRSLSPIAPAIAGSWVAAVGLLAGAFAFQPAEDAAAGTPAASQASGRMSAGAVPVGD